MKRDRTLLSHLAIAGTLVLSGCGRSPAAADDLSAVLDSAATRTVSVDDPAVQKRAFTLTIPKTWRFTGMISRPAGCHGPAVAADGLTFTVMAPDTITAIEKLPGVSWAWMSDGSGFPQCKPVKINTAAEFLLNIAVPNLRPDATNIRMMPLAAQTRQALDNRNRELQSQGNPQTRQTVDAAQVRLSYTYRGHPVEEMLGTSILCREIDMPAYPLLHRPAIQRHICNSPGTTILRAPQGSLDALIAHPLTGVRIDPQWDAEIQQQMQSQFAAWKHSNDAQFAAIQDHFKNVTMRC